ncbi:MAG: DoxX family membrane protein [Bacteroidetes bacterium]|nr:DoxX family membrane protein [Bacteroidota bacterium]
MVTDFKSFTSKLILLRISLGIVYLWFGYLKFFPHLSPAENLAQDTIDALFFKLIPREISIVILAIMESIIGIFLILGRYIRFSVYLALFHLACTFTPLFLYPNLCFQKAFVFTILGQYIVKNIVLVAAMLLFLPDKSRSSPELN